MPREEDLSLFDLTWLFITQWDDLQWVSPKQSGIFNIIAAWGGCKKWGKEEADQIT
jgi:hypothetical protein